MALHSTEIYRILFKSGCSAIKTASDLNSTGCCGSELKNGWKWRRSDETCPSLPDEEQGRTSEDEARKETHLIAEALRSFVTLAIRPAVRLSEWHLVRILPCFSCASFCLAKFYLFARVALRFE